MVQNPPSGPVANTIPAPPPGPGADEEPWRTALQLRVSDLRRLDTLLDKLSRCSRHGLLIAAIRCGLEEFEDRGAEYAAKFLPAGGKARAPRL